MRRWPHRAGSWSARACDEYAAGFGHARTGWNRDQASLGTGAILCAEEIADRSAFLHRLQFGNKFSETLRENWAAAAEIKINAWAGDVMVEELTPTFPKLGVEQTI